MSIKIYLYSKCSTCQKALRFLEEHQIAYEKAEINLTPPSATELKQMLDHLSSIKKLFNTSGMLYREMKLSSQLEQISEEKALQLLSQHGMLVKRPFIVTPSFGLVGFNQEKWLKQLANRPS